MSGRALLLLCLALPACSVDDVKPELLSAPFTVSDYFVPSGYMGDASVKVTPKPMQLDYDACSARPAGALGDCYRFTYTPAPVGNGGVGWGGVYWQSPANNWGQDAPQAVRAGATRVSVVAAGGSGGEIVSLLVGGLSATDPDGAPLPFADTFKAELDVVLTTEPTRYEVPIPADAQYDHVVGGFGFSVTAVGPTAQVLYFDDIRWLGP
jgi:hypothetical protein